MDLSSRVDKNLIFSLFYNHKYIWNLENNWIKL